MRGRGAYVCKTRMCNRNLDQRPPANPGLACSPGRSPDRRVGESKRDLVGCRDDAWPAEPQ